MLGKIVGRLKLCAEGCLSKNKVDDKNIKSLLNGRCYCGLNSKLL